MKEVRLIFETTNAAFDGTNEYYLAAVQAVFRDALSKLHTEHMIDLQQGLTMRDPNGNAIGRLQVI